MVELIRHKIYNIKITGISSKILSGKFGGGHYYGYKNDKIISLVKIESGSKFGFGESLIGTYSPELYKKNIEYFAGKLKSKNIFEAIKIIETYKNNKFFFYQGFLKGILASLEFAILSLISNKLKISLADCINEIYFQKKQKKNKIIQIYSSAGSVNSNLNHLKKDIRKSLKLGINIMKLRIDLSKKYEKKIEYADKNLKKFSVDLIANSFSKNNNMQKVKKFLTYAKNKKILWIEEVININNFELFSKIKHFSKLKFSYGENFNSYFDYYSLLKKYKLNYINIDIGHCSITDFRKIIQYLSTQKKKKKIIFHCWGSLINLFSTLELATLFNDYVYMVEFPIADFKLNDFFLKDCKINNSKIYLQDELKIIEKKYNKFPTINHYEKKCFSFD
jgi:L-alanine-DL-glutamate epimerase-like enolase superfamily enzyme